MMFDISENEGAAEQTVREPEVALQRLRHPTPCFRLCSAHNLRVQEEHMRRLTSNTAFDVVWCTIIELNV